MAIAIAKFGVTPLEASRMTEYEYHLYLLAYKLKMQEQALLTAQQAWQNQMAKATKGRGKNVRPAYKTFDDFYDNKKEFNRIFVGEQKQSTKKQTLADRNRRLNKKGG